MNDTRTGATAGAWQAKKRRQSIVAFILLLLLCAATVFFYLVRQHLGQSQREAASLRIALSSARTQQAEKDVRRALDESDRQMLQLAARRGIGADGWAKRLIDVRSQSVHRHEANEFLLSVARAPGRRYFDFESFEISVRGNEAGIFDSFAQSGAPLVLGARGTLVFRTGSAQ
ncbi:hypothetical protein AGMMS50256_19870 [Betaproteobacteria bacterium]|nr:hypothetical protein AGMMS50256_19870 [Betaproteobacteria bacterium]